MPHKHVIIPLDVWERLKKRKRPHQALAGVIEELLNQADLNNNKEKTEGYNANTRNTTH